MIFEGKCSESKRKEKKVIYRYMWLKSWDVNTRKDCKAIKIIGKFL